MTSSSLNILIIEDADIIVNQLRILLSDKNSTHHIRSANSAELGLELIENLFPDVFIVDIKLPGISGIDLLNKIKQDFDEDYFINLCQLIINNKNKIK